MRHAFALSIAGFIGLTTFGSVAAEPAATRPSFTTAPAAIPSTSPHSRAQKSYLPSAESIRRRLASDDWHERRAAEADLVTCGELGREFVRGMMEGGATDPETHSRLASALARIEENRVVGPSFVTLHVANASPAEVFAELSRQCYVELKPGNPGLFDVRDLPKISADIDRQPFWTAMATISEKTGFDIQASGEDEITINRGSFRMASNHSVVQGPFLIVPTQLSHTRTQVLTTGGAPSNEFSLQFAVYPEPKLKILSTSSAVRVIEATDDAGNSLLPTGEENHIDYGGGNGFWTFAAHLNYPARAGTMIHRFRASASFVVQTGSQTIKIADVQKVKDATQTVAGLPIVIHELKKAGQDWELRISSRAPMPNDPAWMNFRQSLSNRTRLLDATGQAINHRGMRSRGFNGRIETTLIVGPCDRRPFGDPVQLIWEITTETKGITLPIELHDIPMP